MQICGACTSNEQNFNVFDATQSRAQCNAAISSSSLLLLKLLWIHCVAILPIQRATYLCTGVISRPTCYYFLISHWILWVIFRIENLPMGSFRLLKLTHRRILEFFSSIRLRSESSKKQMKTSVDHPRAQIVLYMFICTPSTRNKHKNISDANSRLDDFPTKN